MNGQSHQRAPNKCFLSFVPWQPQNLKPGRTSLIDICEHLLKGVCEGTIPAKPTVETNIIDVRLNFITLRLAFCQQKKKSICYIKVLSYTEHFSCWADTYFWNNHATLVFCPYKGHTQLPGRSFGISSYLWDFLIIWKAQLDYCTPQPPYASLESTNPLLFYPVLRNKHSDLHMLIWYLSLFTDTNCIK